MIITYHGKQFLKLQQGDIVYAYNPIAKKSDHVAQKPVKFGADLALISVRHPDYNGVQNTSFGDKEPFVIQGPGSYEVNGITVHGFGTQAEINDESYINSIYFMVIDGISYGFIGPVVDLNFDSAVKEFTDHVDVLVLPIGGNGTLSPKDAVKITKIFTPHIIIPVDYGKDREKDALDRFLKEMGSHHEPQEKFVFKKKDILGLQDQVIVLKQQ